MRCFFIHFPSISFAKNTHHSCRSHISPGPEDRRRAAYYTATLCRRRRSSGQLDTAGRTCTQRDRVKPWPSDLASKVHRVIGGRRRRRRTTRTRKIKKKNEYNFQIPLAHHCYIRVRPFVYYYVYRHYTRVCAGPGCV